MQLWVACAVPFVLFPHRNAQEYFEDFVAEGYDDMRSIVALDEADLADLGFKKGHKKRFLAARDKSCPPPPLCTTLLAGQESRKQGIDFLQVSGQRLPLVF